MELIVVIAIIALLATVVLVSLGTAKDKSRNAQAVQDAHQLQNALELYRSEHNGYPLDAVWPNNQYYRLLSASEWGLFTAEMKPYVDVSRLTSMVYVNPATPTSNFHYIAPNSAQFYGSGYSDWRCGYPADGVPEQPVRGKYLVMFYSAVPLTLESLYHSGAFQPGYYCFTAK